MDTLVKSSKDWSTLFTKSYLTTTLKFLNLMNSKWCSAENKISMSKIGKETLPTKATCQTILWFSGFGKLCLNLTKKWEVTSFIFAQAQPKCPFKDSGISNAKEEKSSISTLRWLNWIKTTLSPKELRVSINYNFQFTKADNNFTQCFWLFVKSKSMILDLTTLNIDFSLFVL